MPDRALSDAEACAQLLADDPFASGAYLILRLDEAAALIASEAPRSKAAATFTRGHRGPALVLVESEVSRA